MGPWIAGSCLVFALVLSPIPPSRANELTLENPEVLTVGPCSRELRFHVQFSDTNSAAQASYRVGVYSTARNRLLAGYEVKQQQAGTGHLFVVPSDKLICDHSAEIRIEDLGPGAVHAGNGGPAQVSRTPVDTSFSSPCLDAVTHCR